MKTRISRPFPCLVFRLFCRDSGGILLEQVSGGCYSDAPSVAKPAQRPGSVDRLMGPGSVLMRKMFGGRKLIRHVRPLPGPLDDWNRKRRSTGGPPQFGRNRDAAMAREIGPRRMTSVEDISMSGLVLLASKRICTRTSPWEPAFFARCVTWGITSSSMHGFSANWPKRKHREKANSRVPVFNSHDDLFIFFRLAT